MSDKSEANKQEIKDSIESTMKALYPDVKLPEMLKRQAR